MRWIAVVCVAGMASVAAGAAMASPPLLAKAQEKGYPAQGCQYCHGSALPALNERGKWLQEEKKRQNAQAIDLDWLKNYPGDKEPK